MTCCQCTRPIELGPEEIPRDTPRKDLAIRCVYCMRLFCVRCAKGHFEPEWLEHAIEAVKREAPDASVEVDSEWRGRSKLTKVTIELKQETP